MFRTSIIAWICAALLGSAPSSFSAEIITLNGAKVFAGKVLVRVKDPEEGRIRALSVAGGEIESRSKLVPGLLTLNKPRAGGLQALSQEQKAEALEKWIEELKATGQFEYVEPDYVRHYSATPTDAAFVNGTLWGLHNFGQGGGVPGADISATNAWDFSTGSTNVIVAVIDTGIRYTHRDLVNQMWRNPDEVPGDGIDNDNDGYVDNIFGIDPFNDDADPMDDDGHGTHVAGTIGAAANDGNSHVGVAWNVRLMALKVGDGNGFSPAAIIRAMEFAADNGARIINGSYAGYSYSQAEFDAMAALRARGVLFVAAASNENNNNDTFPAYPASYQLDNIISVAAMDRRDLMATFSNYGRNTVHLGAPGVDIYSTYFNSDSDYTLLQGTSMAAPHVSGVAALVAAYIPGAGYSEIRQRILEGVTLVPTLAARTITGGRLNAFRALTRGVDGIMEFSVVPTPDSFLTIGQPTLFSVSLSDGPIVTNATVTLIGGGTNLTLTLDPLSTNLPVSATAGTYTNTYRVPDTPGLINFTLNAVAPGKSNLTAQISYTAVNRPANDMFADALKVPELERPFIHATSNRLATIEGPAEQRLNHGGVTNTEASVWYTWTARERTELIVDTAGSTFDTVIGVYAGTALTNLVEIAAANDVGQRRDAWVRFIAEPGISYKIAIAGVPPNSEGTLQVRFEVNGQPDTVPPIVQILGPVSGITVRESNIMIQGIAFDPEPNASGIPDGGVQYVVSTNQLRNPGDLPVSAQGTTNWTAPVDLVLGVNFITVWAFDKAENRSAERQISVIYRLPLTANDLFFDRIMLSPAETTRTDSNAAATREFGEPAHAGNPGGRSVWYEYRPDASGVLLVSTFGSNFDTLLAIYTSTNSVPTVNSLVELASNDDVTGAGTHSEVTVTVEAGQRYFIAVDGFDGAGGNVQLNYTFSPARVFRVTVLPSIGSGTVTPGTSLFPENATVSFLARPSPGAQFDHFETPTGIVRANPLTMVITGDATLRAVFTTRAFVEDFERGFTLPFEANNWSIAPDPTNSANRVLLSAGNGQNQITNIASVTLRLNAGVGGFDFGTSTERVHDKLEFSITYQREGLVTNRLILGNWAGENRGRFQFAVEPGTARLEWRYIKDRALTEGRDHVFIDNLDLPLFTAASSLSLKNETITLRVAELAGQSVVIEASSDLVTWTAIGTAVADETGAASFSEPRTSGSRFFRFKPQQPASP